MGTTSLKTQRNVDKRQTGKERLSVAGRKPMILRTSDHGKVTDGRMTGIISERLQLHPNIAHFGQVGR